MNDNEASVRITADASAVAPAIQETKGEIAGLAPMLAQLNAQFAELSSQIRASMAGGAASTAEMATEMHALEEATEGETLSLGEMVAMTHEAVEGFSEFRASLSEIAEVWMAAFAVEKIADWAKEFAEAAEHIEHLSQTFGMTTTQIQGLNAIAKETGIGLDTITRAMQTLDKNAVNAAEGNSAVATAFKAVGVSASDGSTQWQRMLTIADKFRDMDDGPKKVALAMELMGRNGAAMIPFLNLGSESIEKMREKAVEYDAAWTAVSDSSQEKGAALAESINETGLAWQGITNVLGDAFGPVLKEIVDSLNTLIKAFIDSYNEGGIVAEVFQGIVSVVEIVGAVINDLAAIFVALWDAVVEVVTDVAQSVADVFGVKLPSNMKTSEAWLNVLKDAFVVLKDVILIVVDTIAGMLVFLIDEFRNFAVQAKDALTMNWGAMDKDWQDGCNRIATHVEQAAGRIKAAMSEAGATMAAAANGAALPAAESGVETSKGGAGGSFDPALGKTPKEKKPKDDLVQQLDEELTTKKLAWSMEQDAQDSAQAYSLASESAFWMEALGRQDLTVKDRLAIEQKYLEAHGQLVKEDIQKSIDGFASQLEAAKGNSATQMQIAEQESDFILKKYGAESTEYAAAQKQIVKIRQETAAQLQAIEDELSKHQQTLALQDITNDEAAAKQRVAMGVETDAQMIQEQIGFEARRYQIQQQALGQQLEAELNGPNNPQKVAALYDQLEALDRAYQAKKTDLVRQAELQRTTIERSAIASLSSSWAQSLSKLVTMQQGFAATVKGLYSGLMDVIAGALAKVIEKWLEQQLAALLLKHTAQSTDGSASVESNAAIAGSAAFASTAAIPVVGPELAPGAAAAAYAATMAFAPLASAAGGWGSVPYDDYPTFLHREEMVLPASLATPLRSMLAGAPVPANLNAPPAANEGGGGVNNHFYGDIKAWDGNSVRKMLMDNGTHVARAADLGVRNGYQPSKR